MDVEDGQDREELRVSGRRFEVIQRTLFVLQFVGIAFSAAMAHFKWIPIQLTIGAFALPMAARACMFSWRRRAEKARRLELGFCAFCDYDRRGIDPSAPCPECNTSTRPEGK